MLASFGVMPKSLRRIFLAVLASLSPLSSLVPASAAETDWQVGLARVKITPENPVVLLGYSNRTGPFETVAADIWAKAMAVEDAAGNRGLIVTTDLVGIQAVIGDPVCARITKKTGLAREQILLNASHSHTGPLVSLNPRRDGNAGHPPLSAADREQTIAYTRRLQDQLVDVSVRAVSALAPAKLAWGRGTVAFPMNRRTVLSDRVIMRANPDAPADRTVPVLRVDTPDGRLRAVLFGCACHNTTLTDAHNFIAGDYAGFAQQSLEEQHPGVQAMFMSGCGADANPHPRGTMEQAKIHGRVLAAEVRRVMGLSLDAVNSPLAIAAAQVELPLKRLARAEIEHITTLPSTEAAMAKQMLNVLESGGTLPGSYVAPLPVWQFGDDLTLVALPAEPVADYVARLQSALGPGKLWISGYNNDCFGYLPSARIVAEGGHEAIGITLWIWGDHLSESIGFFAPDVEQTVVTAARRLAEKCGRPLPAASTTTESDKSN